MNTYRTLYLMIKEVVKELRVVITRQGKALEEQKRALHEKDLVIEDLRRKLKMKQK